MRLLRNVALVIAVLVGATATVVSPASAGTVYGCPDGYLCFYKGTSWNHGHPSVIIRGHIDVGGHTQSGHGWSNLHGMYGVYRVLNNADCTKVSFNEGYNGGGPYHATDLPYYTWFAPYYFQLDMTPYNSVTFWWWCK